MQVSEGVTEMDGVRSSLVELEEAGQHRAREMGALYCTGMLLTGKG